MLPSYSIDELGRIVDKYQQIETWLEHTLGGTPDQIHLSDLRQQLSMVVDLQPLLRILGGKWERVLCEGMDKMEQQRNAKSRGLAQDREEGWSLSLGKTKKGLTGAPAGAKEFRSASSVAMDVSGKAYDQEKKISATVPAMPVVQCHRDDGVVLMCAECVNKAAANWAQSIEFYRVDRGNGQWELVCTRCGDVNQIPDGYHLKGEGE